MASAIMKGKDRISAFPFPFSSSVDGRGEMDAQLVLKIIVLTLSAFAMLLGIAVMAGFLVPPNVPAQFRFLAGIVIFLYGCYRFAVAFTRKENPRR